jgi:hypothetical protein
MDQKDLIKALVKVLREDIKKTLKEEIRIAVKEVLNETINETPKQKVNENYQMKSRDDGSYGTIQYGQRPMISPSDLGYGDNFREYSQPEAVTGGTQSEYGSYLQGQEQGGIPLEHKLAMAAQRNPDATAPVLKALNRDYSQLVKKFNKG